MPLISRFSFWDITEFRQPLRSMAMGRRRTDASSGGNTAIQRELTEQKGFGNSSFWSLQQAWIQGISATGTQALKGYWTVEAHLKQKSGPERGLAHRAVSCPLHTARVSVSPHAEHKGCNRWSLQSRFVIQQWKVTQQSGYCSYSQQNQRGPKPEWTLPHGRLKPQFLVLVLRSPTLGAVRPVCGSCPASGVLVWSPDPSFPGSTATAILILTRLLWPSYRPQLSFCNTWVHIGVVCSLRFCFVGKLMRAVRRLYRRTNGVRWEYFCVG